MIYLTMAKLFAGRVLKYIGRNLWILPGIVAVFFYWQSGHYQSKYANEAALRKDDRANYESAQADAKLLDDARIARITLKYEQITKEKTHEYDQSISDLRRNLAANRVRGQVIECQAGAIKLPVISEMSAGTLQSAGGAVISARDSELTAQWVAQHQSLIDLWRSMETVK